ncbi:hypothetical protein [Sphingomonas glacialis]|uniref:hypothetical protein n=1 Tax=Sphingomonas glacialis TaxID=658225 RepID=UPI001127F0AE
MVVEFFGDDSLAALVNVDVPYDLFARLVQTGQRLEGGAALRLCLQRERHVSAECFGVFASILPSAAHHFGDGGIEHHRLSKKVIANGPEVPGFDLVGYVGERAARIKRRYRLSIKFDSSRRHRVRHRRVAHHRIETKSGYGQTLAFASCLLDLHRFRPAGAVCARRLTHCCCPLS